MIQHLCNDVTIHLMPTASPLLILKHPPILECFLSPPPHPSLSFSSRPDKTQVVFWSYKKYQLCKVAGRGEGQARKEGTHVAMKTILCMFSLGCFDSTVAPTCKLRSAFCPGGRQQAQNGHAYQFFKNIIYRSEITCY